MCKKQNIIMKVALEFKTVTLTNTPKRSLLDLKSHYTKQLTIKFD